MTIEGWKYYNHAAIPTVAPHEDIDVDVIMNKEIWRISGALFARWTSNYDCQTETNWWYIIKDSPFEIDSLKAKRRYEVRKGIKHFKVCRIDPRCYKEELCSIQIAAFSAYPAKYRPHVDCKKFFSDIDLWDKRNVYGAFYRDTGKLCGYAILDNVSERCVEFNVLKVDPNYEVYGINAAIVNEILEDYRQFLENGYILDGARSINHETKFQDYLEKYFNFRKAYCNLHVEYNPKIKWIVKIVYPFRKVLLRMDCIGIIHKINSVLVMENIIRDR